MAQELAKTGAKLTGLDLAPAMIEIARQNAVEESLDIDYRIMDWVLADLVSLGWVKKFDVVMASRTPAIFNRQTLEKMMLVSSGYGVFISAVDINNTVRDILTKTLGWDETRARATRSSYMVWNILWLLGYYPQIFYQDTEWEDEVKMEEALITNRRFFEMSCGALTQEKVDMMTGALERISCNGLVLERVCSRTEVIIWKIRRTDSGDVK
jgi:SAM-dependent methyltransferase